MEFPFNLSVTANFCRQEWDLLDVFCTRASVREFEAALFFTHYHWHDACMGQRTPIKVFKQVKESHDIDQSIPDPVVTVSEMGSWDQEGAIQAQDEERKKALHITFRQIEGGGVLVASFVLEKKKKVSECLEDLAAVIVAKQMADKSHIEIVVFAAKTQFERGKKLPEKLFGIIKTVEWVQSHRLHIEQDKRRQMEVQESAKKYLHADVQSCG